MQQPMVLQNLLSLYHQLSLPSNTQQPHSLNHCKKNSAHLPLHHRYIPCPLP